MESVQYKINMKSEKKFSSSVESCTLKMMGGGGGGKRPCNSLVICTWIFATALPPFTANSVTDYFSVDFTFK